MTRLRSARSTGWASSISMLAMCTMFAATSAHAQTDAAAEEIPEDAIVVTGIRQSLASSQNIKRDSDTIVDAITAEDIGALPDRSVTEALQRIPGISINRFAGSNDPDHFSVEGSGVVVRGLNFVRSEFNGRTAFAAGVGGQALNFADVPGELLGSVVVSKNATADMIEGGLAGTVNLNTRKPFDQKGLKLSFGAEANYGDMAKKWTPTFFGLVSNTWDTEIGRIGLLFGGAFSQIKSQADGAQIANYQNRDGREVNGANNGPLICRAPLPGNTDTQTLPAAGAACGVLGTAGADGRADYNTGFVAPVGGQFRRQEFDRKRDSFNIAAQWESVDQRTKVTLEFIRSHTTNEWGEYTFESGPDLADYITFPVGCRQNTDGPGGRPRADCPTTGTGAFTNYVYDENGLFQSGYIVNADSGWRGGVNGPGSPFIPVGGVQQSLARRQVLDETTNQELGFNLKSELTERLKINIDAQYTKSRKENLDVSVFGSLFADSELDISGDLPIIQPRMPTYLGYVWGSTPSPELVAARTNGTYFTDPRFQFWRAAMDHIEDSEGEQYAFQADAEYDIGEDAFIRKIKVGARYQDREQTVRYTTYNWGNLSEVWSGTRPVNFADAGANQANRYDFPDFFRNKVPGPPGAYYYSGDLLGNYTGSVVYFRSIGAISTNQFGATNAKWTGLVNRPRTTELDLALTGTPYLGADIQPVSQIDSAAYIRADFGSDTLLGGIRLSGNIGVRYVSSKITSTGALGAPSRQQLGVVDDFSVQCAPRQPPVGSPPGTPAPALPFFCQQGQAFYESTQRFATGLTTRDVAKNSYDYFLPSFNLKLGLSDDLIGRFAVSKVLTRPDNANIRNFLTIGRNQQTNRFEAQAGNPFLKPATAWQFDLSLEWYFARVGSLTLNGFHKEVKGFFYQNVVEQQRTSNGVTVPVFVRGPANFDGTGKITGFEIAYQQTLDFLPGFLNGLGVNTNYTYIKSKGLPNSFLNGGNIPNVSTVAPSGDLPLEQLSKHNLNASVFYEKGPISLRAAYNWRSRFLLTASDVIYPYYSIFNEPTGQLDASMFVQLNKAVRIGVQGVNLLNEVTKTTQSYDGTLDGLAPRSYFMNDRRFSFIIRGNF